MNYLILVIVGIVGVVIGSYFGVRKKENLISKQSKQKQHNKDKILEFLENSEKITNNDVEKLLGVSDSTAERYLNELEKEQKIKQIGTVGHAVYYRLMKP